VLRPVAKRAGTSSSNGFPAALVLSVGVTVNRRVAHFVLSAVGELGPPLFAWLLPVGGLPLVAGPSPLDGFGLASFSKRKLSGFGLGFALTPLLLLPFRGRGLPSFPLTRRVVDFHLVLASVVLVLAPPGRVRVRAWFSFVAGVLLTLSLAEFRQSTLLRSSLQYSHWLLLVLAPLRI